MSSKALADSGRESASGSSSGADSPREEKNHRRILQQIPSVAGTIEDQSLEYRESEINEEEFTPDLQKVEQVRLEAIVKSRSLLRDTELGKRSQVDPNLSALEESSELCIGRSEIEALHHQLSAVAVSKNSVTTTTSPPMTNASSNDAHDYMNQDIVDMVLHDDQTTETDLNVGNAEADQGSQRLPSSNGYRSQGNPSIRKSGCAGQRQQQPVALPYGGDLGEFEKRLLLAKQKSKALMPNVYQIPWYHPGISRHVAESLLVSKNTPDGTYLLRDCVAEADTVTLSVRCQDSVKHYKVTWDGKQFNFGLGKFSTLKDFMDHFANQPLISGDSGVLVQLRYSYPRGVSEPAIYHEASTWVASEEVKEPSEKQKPHGNKKHSGSSMLNSMDLSINSKEGYLTKLGFHRKNWKKRWFVLYRNELKYFNNLGDKEPLKIINLEDVMRVDRDDSTGKPNCLRLVTSYRTFFMYATSEVEANEWVQILDWRLKQQRAK